LHKNFRRDRHTELQILTITASLEIAILDATLLALIPRHNEICNFELWVPTDNIPLSVAKLLINMLSKALINWISA
jgi:hypothetical protein